MKAIKISFCIKESILVGSGMAEIHSFGKFGNLVSNTAKMRENIEYQ